MTEEERQQYAKQVIQRTVGIAANPYESDPPFFRHRLTESNGNTRYEYGAALIAFFLPDAIATSVLFAFTADYIRGLDAETLNNDYLPIITELELPQRIANLELELVEKYPEIGQWEPEDLMQTCIELGIPYAFLIFAEDDRTEEDVPILFHPMFMTPSQALRGIQLAAEERIKFLTKKNEE